jgi:signal transduction histidine kinase
MLQGFLHINKMRSAGMGFSMGQLWLILAFFLIAAPAAHASADIAALSYTKIEQAELSSLAGVRQVKLPHMLSNQDFAPQGSLVRYTLLYDLQAPVDTSLGIFVPKLALSGHVLVNGKLFASCEPGKLENLRCLSRPYLFTPPPDFWKPGLNQITFEIYATGGQSNGLSSVTVGDVGVLDTVFYHLNYWLKVDLLMGLTWLSAVLGVLSLVVSRILKNDAVYLWFGIASLANAAANLAFLDTKSSINIQWYNWFIFSSRFVSSQMFLMMFAAFFDKLSPKLRNASIAYMLLSILLVALSNNSRLLVSIIYLPVMFSGSALLFWMAYSAWKIKNLKHIAALVLMFLLFLAGLSDWLRLTSASAFEGVYFIPYALSGVMLVFGGLLLALMARALVDYQALSNELELRVEHRTAELNKLHEYLLNKEVEQSKEQERTRLLQDMHDGFGSQLVVARMMSKRNSLSQSDLTNLLDDCISDLHLVVDTISNDGKTLSEALVDLRYRTQTRIFSSDIKFHWYLHLDEFSEIPHQIILQILRIVQEAISNSIKHANAKNIWIVVAYVPNVELKVSVSDDGVGTNPEARAGRGLNNMKTRAKSIGAELVLDSFEIGSDVTFCMPFDEKSRLALLASPRHRPTSS